MFVFFSLFVALLFFGFCCLLRPNTKHQYAYSAFGGVYDWAARSSSCYCCLFIRVRCMRWFSIFAEPIFAIWYPRKEEKKNSSWQRARTRDCCVRWLRMRSFCLVSLLVLWAGAFWYDGKCMKTNKIRIRKSFVFVIHHFKSLLTGNIRMQDTMYDNGSVGKCISCPFIYNYSKQI